MNTLPRSLMAVLLAATLALPCVFAADTVQRIYTAPDPADRGGIKGSCAANITHALAVNHDRLRVYRGTVSADGGTFDFPASARREVRPGDGDERQGRLRRTVPR